MTDPVTITNGELLSAIPALREILSLKPKAKIGFQIQRAMKQIQNEVDALSETLKEMDKEHILKDEAGSPIPATDAAGKPVENSFKVKDPEKYKTERDELMETEIKLTITPIPLDLIKDMEITIATLSTLDWLFKE